MSSGSLIHFDVILGTTVDEGEFLPPSSSTISEIGNTSFGSGWAIIDSIINGSMNNDDDHEIFEDNEEVECPIKKRKQHTMPSTKCSWVWAHFKRSEGKTEYALCLLCNKEVYYSKDYSTSMLSRHINRFHKPVYTQHLVAEADKKLAIPENAKVTMDSYIINFPKFEQALITWMIATYQPLWCCEDVNFRAHTVILSKDEEGENHNKEDFD